MEEEGWKAVGIAIPVLCLCVINEEYVLLECTSLLFTSSVDCLDSLYHIPNGMFCSSHSYLLFSSWMACMQQLVCISF